MVASRASASKEEAPTAISTSSTTLPIVLEAAHAPASMCEHMMVGERARSATQRAQGFAVFREWTDEGQEVWGWRLRTLMERLDADVLPPRVFVASQRLPRHAQSVTGRERHAVERRAQHTCRRRRAAGARRGGRPVHAGELGALLLHIAAHGLEHDASQRSRGCGKGDILVFARGGSWDWGFASTPAARTVACTGTSDPFT